MVQQAVGPKIEVRINPTTSSAHGYDSVTHTGTVEAHAWISGAAMKGTATNGAGDANKLPESREGATNQVNYDYIAFDDTTSEHAYFQWVFPGGWDEGTITWSLYWTSTGGSGAQTIDFDLRATSLDNSGALDAQHGVAQNVTQTITVQNDMLQTSESSALTIRNGPSEGDFIIFDLSRDVASDNLNGDCDVLGVRLILTRDNIGD